MDLPRELLQLAEIYGGEKGYVPVRDNAAQKGMDVGKAANGLQLLVPARDRLTPAQQKVYFDSGWCQVASPVNDDLFVPITGENWVEMSHVRLLPDPVTPPAPTPAKKKYRITAVFDIEEL